MSRMVHRSVAIAGLLVLAGCPASTRPPPAVAAGGGAGGAGLAVPGAGPTGDVALLGACARALAAIPGLEPASRVLALADGCGRALPGFPELARIDPAMHMLVLADRSDLLCPSPAIGRATAVPPEEKWDALVGICGPGHYGLPPGAEPLMSIDWFIVQRVGTWIARTRAAAGPAAPAGLDAALAAARFELAVPAFVAGAYRLPPADEGVTARAGAAVVIRPRDLLASAWPAAGLDAEGIRLLEGRGGGFPGARVELGDLERTVLALRGALATPPLVLIDGDLPVGRLLDVASRLPRAGARLGVAAGGEARAHRVHLEAGPSPVALEVTVRDASLEVRTPQGVVGLPGIAGDPDLGLAPILDVAALEAALRAGLGVGADDLLGVKIDARTPIRDLAAILDAAARAGVTRAQLAAAPPAPAAAGAGAGAPPVGAPPAGAPPAAKTPPVRPGLPVVKFEPPTVGPSLDPAVIRRVVRRAMPRIRACYERQLAVAPELRGRATVEFTYDATGAVTSATVTGFDPAVDECLAAVLRGLTFPSPPGGGTVRVSYPFSFQPDRP